MELVVLVLRNKGFAHCHNLNSFKSRGNGWFGLFKEMCTAAPFVGEDCCHLENIWSNFLPLYLTANSESSRHLNTPAFPDILGVHLSGTRLDSSNGYWHNFIQPLAIAIWPKCDDQCKYSGGKEQLSYANISTVILSSFTTRPQTATFGDFVWNSALQTAKKNVKWNPPFKVLYVCLSLEWSNHLKH